MALQASVRRVYVDPALVRYAQRLAGGRRGSRRGGPGGSSRRTSTTASAPAGPSTSHSPRGRSPRFAAVATSSPTTCGNWPRTSSGTGIVLSYEALADGISPDDARSTARSCSWRCPIRTSRVFPGIVTVILQLSRRERTPARPGPGPLRDGQLRKLDLTLRRARRQSPPRGTTRALRSGDETAPSPPRPYVVGDDVRKIDCNVTATPGDPHVRAHVSRSTRWPSRLLLDASASMTFGCHAGDDVTDGEGHPLGDVPFTAVGGPEVIDADVRAGASVHRVLRDVRPDVRLAGPRGHVPVDPPDVVADDVRPHLGELGSAPRARRAVVAEEDPVDAPAYRRSSLRRWPRAAGPGPGRSGVRRGGLGWITVTTPPPRGNSDRASLRPRSRGRARGRRVTSSASAS